MSIMLSGTMGVGQTSDAAGWDDVATFLCSSRSGFTDLATWTVRAMMDGLFVRGHLGVMMARIEHVPRGRSET
ncbi:hypothetical protein TorRG33x02_340540 [Trema orientale]|uniref:Uncharacterized protein n=1 Tax=Trema orientale TaxID=63057 RepID=A0A2P5AV07_TREOI|nr:hypothetical protein TorRG33x02_340540 [Trema orientale]